MPPPPQPPRITHLLSHTLNPKLEGARPPKPPNFREGRGSTPNVSTPVYVNPFWGRKSSTTNKAKPNHAPKRGYGQGAP